MLRNLSMLSIALAILSPALIADQIVLKNGDRLTGNIIKSDGKTLTMKSEFAGTVTVPVEALEQIRSDQPLYLILSDGQTIVGTVATSEGKLEVRTSDAGAVSFNKDAVRILRSKEAQAAYQAEQERLRNPRLSDLWSGSTDAGLSLTRGNAETATFSWGMNAARSTSRDKIGVYAAALNSKNSTTGKSLTTANAIRGGARYDINITGRHFAFGLGDLEYDEFQKLDLRMVLGGGLGWHAKKTERVTFDVFGGGTLNKEYFSTGLKRSSGEVLIGEELAYKLSGRTSLKEKMVFLPNMSETGEYRLTFDTSVLTNISSWLGWHVTLGDRYLSNPVPGTKSNDVLLTTGVRFTFGK